MNDLELQHNFLQVTLHTLCARDDSADNTIGANHHSGQPVEGYSVSSVRVPLPILENECGGGRVAGGLAFWKQLHRAHDFLGKSTDHLCYTSAISLVPSKEQDGMSRDAEDRE
jgi:hypothetical protein